VEHYSVVVSGFKRGEEFFRGRMMKQGMKVAQIERVIQAVPCILKQGLSLDEAKRFEGVFRDAGAIVEVLKDGAPVPGGPEDDVTDRRPRHSQPRLTPLVQPLPAPPEEPPPPAASDASLGIGPGAGAGAGAGAETELLDLMEGPAPGVAEAAAGSEAAADSEAAAGSEAAADSEASANSEAAAGSEASAAPAPPLPHVTGLLPTTGKPPAVFTEHNPWIFRGVGIGAILLFSLITVSCVSKYKVGERIHDFSVAVDDELANDMIGLARLHGGAVGEADIYKLVDDYARRAHVKVEISNLRVGFAMLTQGPGGVCSGVLPPSVEDMPQDKRMQWMLRVRRCAPEPWVIGFDVAITARVGVSRDTVRTQQWIFAADWTDPAP
jgi:hypothetical protein